MKQPPDMDLWYKYVAQKEEPYLVPQPKKQQVSKQKSLDLHGLTLQKAFEATAGFLERSQKNGLKNVIIITGASGQIKREFEAWMTLPKFKKLVQYYNPKNSGSYEVKLRK